MIRCKEVQTSGFNHPSFDHISSLQQRIRAWNYVGCVMTSSEISSWIFSAAACLFWSLAWQTAESTMAYNLQTSFDNERLTDPWEFEIRISFSEHQRLRVAKVKKNRGCVDLSEPVVVGKPIEVRLVSLFSSKIQRDSTDFGPWQALTT